ncbi:MAG: Rpn family recombination-promoting nuclease/putative transposase [Marinilabiliaceae bacterium]|nr:Rpn family recombination-promoting nuclease/putative transposase [Marinilabiliaceae bacterium]
MYQKNLIRFDWAIKRLLRNKANFTVLEGFLSELFKRDLKINKILESESNQNSSDDKFNRVDILVEDLTGELMIIEIQNQNEYDYFQRMIYGTAKVISDFINLGEPYENIKKVYSINIVYFDLGQGADYVYHGRTDFKGLHHLDTLKLSDKQKEMFGKAEPYQLFPEYYVIKVNQFNDIAKDSLDEWIYYLKNNEIPDNFKAKGLEQAREILKLDNLTESERSQYIVHLENLSYKASMVRTWKFDEEELIRKENSKEIARRAKQKGYSIESIVDLTGLTKEEIENL